MPWTDLVRRDWTEHTPADRLDPYLVWADTSLFSDFRIGAAVRLTIVAPREPRLPVLIELREPVTRATVKAVLGAVADEAARRGTERAPWRVGSRVRVTSAVCGSRFVSLTVPAEFFEWFSDQRFHDLVVRAEVSIPVKPQRPAARPEMAADIATVGDSPVVMGIIDDGCPFARRGFADPTRGTRVKALWVQDLSGVASSVSSRPGVRTRADLAASIRKATSAANVVDENRCYELEGLNNLRRHATHGGHVLDVMAGPVASFNRTVRAGMPPPTFKPDGSVASKADIVFVQLPRDAIQDNSGKWLGTHMLDGLRFICAHTPKDGRAIVNISYGPQTGPHDGSSMLERAIDETHELMQATGRGLYVALPSGNGYDNRHHAAFTLAPGASETLRWQVPPGSEMAAFLEIWLPERCPLDMIDVSLTPAGRDASERVTVRAGDMKVWPEQARPKAGVIFLKNVPQAVNRTMVLVALARTASFDRDRPVAPSGAWIVEVTNRCNCAVGPVLAYIARNGSDMGASLRGRESHFADRRFDPYRYLRRADDDAQTPNTPIRRKGSLTGMSTGKETVVLAGYRQNDGKRAPYSAAGPSTGMPPKNPSWAEVSEESPGLRGVRAGGTTSGAHVRVAGTSVSSPQEARRAAQSSLPFATFGIGGPPDAERDGLGQRS